MSMTAAEHLSKASDIVNGSRQNDYGAPEDNHACTAALWTAYLRRTGIEIEATLSPQDVCILNILQKVSRFAHRQTDDCITDIIGYALNIAMIQDAHAPASTPATGKAGA